MVEKDNLHPYQMRILYKIMFLPDARFSDLNIQGVTSDLLTYHINKLVQLGFVAKETDKNSDSTVYKLTTKGKRYINTIDTETTKQERFGKRGVLLRAVRYNEELDDFEYLCNKRLKHPFYGYYGFHTGKIREGETIIQTARREFLEETGLKIVDFEFVGINHLITFNENKEFLRDIYFYIFNIYKNSGELVDNIEDGVKNIWVTEQRLKTLKTFPRFWDDDRLNWRISLKAGWKKYRSQKNWINPTDPIDQDNLSFIEQIQIVSNY